MAKKKFKKLEKVKTDKKQITRVKFKLKNKKVFKPLLKIKDNKKLPKFIYDNIWHVQKSLEKHKILLFQNSDTDLLKNFNKTISDFSLTTDKKNDQNTRIYNSTKVNKEILSEIIDSNICQGVLNLKEITDKYNTKQFLDKRSINSIRQKVKELGFKYTYPSKISIKTTTNDSFQRKLVMINEFDKLLSNGGHFIFVDESYIGGKLRNRKKWCYKKSENVLSCIKFLGRLSLLMAIDKNEVLHFKFYRTSITALLYFDFINELIEKILNHEQLKVKYLENKIFVFSDNASIHCGNKYLNELSEKNINFFFNVAYECKFNPIEYIFNIIKQNLKLIKDDSLNSREDIILEGIFKLKKEMFINCYNHIINSMIDELETISKIKNLFP